MKEFVDMRKRVLGDLNGAIRSYDSLVKIQEDRQKKWFIPQWNSTLFLLNDYQREINNNLELTKLFYPKAEELFEIAGHGKKLLERIGTYLVFIRYLQTSREHRDARPSEFYQRLTGGSAFELEGFKNFVYNFKQPNLELNIFNFLLQFRTARKTMKKVLATSGEDKVDLVYPRFDGPSDVAKVQLRELFQHQREQIKRLDSSLINENVRMGRPLEQLHSLFRGKVNHAD